MLPFNGPIYTSHRPFDPFGYNFPDLVLQWLTRYIFSYAQGWSEMVLHDLSHPTLDWGSQPPTSITITHGDAQQRWWHSAQNWIDLQTLHLFMSCRNCWNSSEYQMNPIKVKMPGFESRLSTSLFEGADEHTKAWTQSHDTSRIFVSLMQHGFIYPWPISGAINAATKLFHCTFLQVAQTGMCI